MNFNLETFKKNTKNNNVRIFLEGTAREGQRTSIGVSAIGTLKTVMLHSDIGKDEIAIILHKLTADYCNRTGAKMKEFSTALNIGNNPVVSKFPKIKVVSDLGKSKFGK